MRYTKRVLSPVKLTQGSYFVILKRWFRVQLWKDKRWGGKRRKERVEEKKWLVAYYRFLKI